MSIAAARLAPRRLRRAALALSLAVPALAATAAPLVAQSAAGTRWAQGGIEYRPFGGPARDVSVCDVSSATGAFYQACDIAGIATTGKAGSAAVVAQVDPSGALHAGAFVDWYQQDLGITFARAYANAMYSDRFTFGAVVPASLVFDLHLSGDVVGADSFGELTLNPGIFPDAYLELRANQGGVKSGQFTVRMDSDLPGSTYDFTLSLFVHAMGYGLSKNTSTKADFLNTAYVNGIRALDASGRDITAAVVAAGVTSTMGASYGGFSTAPIQTTTPEPATLALLGGGLLGVGAIGARRRRRS